MAKGRRKTDGGRVSAIAPTDTPLPDDGTTTPAGDSPVDRGRIAQRAYELYLERGGNHGRDQDDWYEAERELRQNGSSRAGDENER